MDLDQTPKNPLDVAKDEFLRRVREGESIDAQEFLDAHPDLSSKLKIQDLEKVRAIELARQKADQLPKTAPGGPLFEDSSTWFGGKRHRVIRELGRGSFGKVYLAHDVKLDREVAIKVCTSQTSNDAVDPLKEAQALAKLDHPNIVAVHDSGRTNDEKYYMVSKFIDGQELSKYLRQKKRSLEEFAVLFAQIADALQFAHKNGFVHRDIKPANILIDSQGKPYVVDFGLALKNQDFGTGTGFAGTLRYMSPEQAKNRANLVDGRSDIYSLGVVFYEMLTGKSPYRKCGDTFALQEEIANEEIEPCPLRQHDESLPKEFEEICVKAMSKSLENRYSTAADMAADLRQFLEKNEAELVDEKAIVHPHSTSIHIGFGPIVFSIVLFLGMVAISIMAVSYFLRDQGGPLAVKGPTSNNNGGDGLAIGAATAQDGAERDARTSANASQDDSLRLQNFSVKYIASDGEVDERKGLVGVQVFDARQGDSVRLTAEFSQPAYAYLIAFRADGAADICWPEDESTPPPLAAIASYPPAEKPLEMFGLDEGVGIWSFLVVASSKPLPSFKQWREARDKPPWKAEITAPLGTVWNLGPQVDDIFAITAETASHQTRSKGRIERGAAELVDLLKWAKADPEVDVVQGRALVTRPRHRQE